MCKNAKMTDTLRSRHPLRKVRKSHALRRSYIIYIKYYVNLEKLYESFTLFWHPDWRTISHALVLL